MTRAITTAQASPICMTAKAGTMSTSVVAIAMRYTGRRPTRSDRDPMSGSDSSITTSTGTVTTADVRFDSPLSSSR